MCNAALACHWQQLQGFGSLHVDAAGVVDLAPAGRAAVVQELERVLGSPVCRLGIAELLWTCVSCLSGLLLPFVVNVMSVCFHQLSAAFRVAPERPPLDALVAAHHQGPFRHRRFNVDLKARLASKDRPQQLLQHWREEYEWGLVCTAWTR